MHNAAESAISNVRTGQIFGCQVHRLSCKLEAHGLPLGVRLAVKTVFGRILDERLDRD